MSTCTKAKRHKWKWVKNRMVGQGAGTNAYVIRKRGVYVCECGKCKFGAPKLEQRHEQETSN